MRKTKQRTQILAVLKEAGVPMSAREVSNKLGDVDLVTVYRNLDLFTKERLVKKLQLEGEAQYEFQKTPHHHAVCDTCKKVIHFDVDEKKLEALVAVSGFTASEIDIVAKGECSRC